MLRDYLQSTKCTSKLLKMLNLEDIIYKIF